MTKLNIAVGRIWDWEIGEQCNDCEEIAHLRVKYPKLKEIQVCINCYRKYYKKQVEKEY